MREHLFRDPISNRECMLRIGVNVDRLRPGMVGMGVRHGTCVQMADVSPELDAFYCPGCGWNGRVSGAWVMEKLDESWDEESRGATPEAEENRP